LGEPLFLGDFGLEGIVFFILADGTEAELFVGRKSGLHEIHDVGRTEPFWTRRRSLRAQSFLGVNPISPNRPKRSAASCIGSGTICRISSQRSDADSFGGPTANSRRCAAST
jgi:hypothetical protein